MKKIKQTDILQFARFCVVGTSNAVIDFGVLNLLLWLFPTSHTLKILGYNSMAVLLASTNSFFCNKYWTFRQHGPVTSQEVYRFCVLAGGTTFTNDTLMWFLGREFPGLLGSSLLGANALKLGAIIGTLSISFLGMRLWVFFRQSSGRDVHSLAVCETDRLPAIQRVYDQNTAIVGAIKPAHDATQGWQPSPDVSRIDHQRYGSTVSVRRGEAQRAPSLPPFPAALPFTPLPERGAPRRRRMQSIKLEYLDQARST